MKHIRKCFLPLQASNGRQPVPEKDPWKSQALCGDIGGRDMVTIDREQGYIDADARQFPFQGVCERCRQARANETVNAGCVVLGRDSRNGILKSRGRG